MAAISRPQQWLRANQRETLSVGVSVAVIVASLWIGGKARVVDHDLTVRRAAWEERANQLATVQQQFRVPSASESEALVAESVRLGALGVPEGDRLDLIDSLGRLAEACSLTDVRVNAGPASDSAYAPERQIAGNRIKPADYAISVEFGGSFANAVKFVSSLPPSVSLSRMSAARRVSATQYQLILTVYELDANFGT